MKKPVLLAILDGFGIRQEVEGNAVAQAKKPNFDRYFNNYPHDYLHADGQFVGLPNGQMGNSEVGHLNIGAGRVVYQSLALLNKEISTGDFFENEKLKKACDNAKKGNLHIFALLSDGGVHSHITHILATLEMAKKNCLENVFIHVVLDGRDVAPKSSKNFILQLEAKMKELECGKIATISGRYYAMDRDKRWDRVELAYQAIVEATSDREFTNSIDYIESRYELNEFDEFIKPGVNSNVKQKIEDGDSVIFTNFRPDRALQMAGVLTNEKYNPKPEEPIFTPSYRPKNLVFVQMMKYSNEVIGDVAYKLVDLVNTYGDVIADAGMKQVRIAETEKYPHVTFFFDGGVDKETIGLEKILINSPKVATYDLQPEMSAYKVTEALLSKLEEGETDTYILNFANPDMVGHSGMLEPTIKAIEVVDECLGEIIDKIIALGGSAIITADHGNAELVTNSDNSPNTAHTTNPVPIILVKEGVEIKEDGSLCDIAPTLLELLSVEQPKEMTGESLIKWLI